MIYSPRALPEQGQRTRGINHITPRLRPITLTYQTPELQSTYRQHHSTETALLKVKNDLLMPMDKGQVTLLVLLDLSSAFDTVEHEILLDRFRSTVELGWKVLSWFESYFEGRPQKVSINGTLSKPFDLMCGVPQGACLGPLLFTIYVSKLFQIF